MKHSKDMNLAPYLGLFEPVYDYNLCLLLRIHDTRGPCLYRVPEGELSKTNSKTTCNLFESLQGIPMQSTVEFWSKKKETYEAMIESMN